MSLLLAKVLAIQEELNFFGLGFLGLLNEIRLSGQLLGFISFTVAGHALYELLELYVQLCLQSLGLGEGGAVVFAACQA
jgi:hypothetical protein